nr:MAG TPA: hypothetical protein [Crassvirales sp.]DAL80314.1 MAG TPA: hypothetical protein [Caudoviricetes sp.]DAU06224.1 MAG TPA: hypothetical protein [Caudoviricetes sp.]DAX21817.1 MAG TPA: hypothetical protein [Caudoviricetes sp.]
MNLIRWSTISSNYQSIIRSNSQSISHKLFQFIFKVS